MKGSILYRRYLVRFIPFILGIGLLIFVLLDDSHAFLSNTEFVWIIGIGIVSVILNYNLIRRPKEYIFVNSLPVTKKQQWLSFYLAVLTTIIAEYVIYIVCAVFTNVAYVNPVELVVSVLVKILMIMLILTVVLWFMSHIAGNWMVGWFAAFMLLIGASFMTGFGKAFQKIFLTGHNNPVYALKEYWHIMTNPLRQFEALEHAINKQMFFPDYSVQRKILITSVYMLITVVLTAFLAYRARTNFSKTDLAVRKSSIAIGFPKTLVCIFFAIYFGMMLSAISLSIVSEDSGYSEAEGSNDGREEITIMDNNAVYQKGYYYGYDTDLYRYEIFGVKYPGYFTAIFIVTSTIGAGIGAGVGMVVSKRAGRREDDYVQESFIKA